MLRARRGLSSPAPRRASSSFIDFVNAV
jgi:hypothetical protein